jgi:hypothetical protein
LFEIHKGNLQPVEQVPVKARGHGGFPDKWN